MTTPVDAHSSSINLRGAARFLTNFVGLFDDDREIGLINKLVETLNGVLNDHELSHIVCSSGKSNSLLKYVEQRFTQENCMMGENIGLLSTKNAAQNVKNCYRTCRYKIVSFEPQMSEVQWVESLSKRSSDENCVANFLKESQKDNISGIKVTSWATTKNQATLDFFPQYHQTRHHTGNNLRSQFSQVKKIRMHDDYYHHNMSSDAKFDGLEEKDSPTGRPSAFNECTDGSMLSRLELPSKLSLNGQRPKASSHIRNPSDIISPPSVKETSEDQTNKNSPKEFRDIPEMWSLQFSQPSKI